MYEHSIKVPRHYKIASNILKKVSTEGGSIKTLLYDEKFRHFRTNVLFALLTETIKHAAQIDKIFEISGIFAAEPRLDPWLAKVLTAEILYGKKTLPGKSKPEITILSYKDKFQIHNNENADDDKIKGHWRPRYVRINTNLLTTSDAIRTFQDEGYKFIRCTSGSYDDYLQQIQSLTEYDFTQDYHVKTMFVFTSGTKLHDHDLYHENKIILQDKATAMAVHLLAPPPGSIVLDMCAAPGMKTTQLAAYIKNQGKIYAVERNNVRYETLCDFVKRTESKCVETLNKDAFELRKGEYDDVEYIILDPSCSGSGMSFSVHNYVEDTRLARLTSLQEKFLKHAMNAFPKAKRIVYSTCSLFPEENERVITNVVKTSRAKWRVQDVKELLKGQWNNYGSGMYGTMGPRCLYAKPESDFTTGFFLAVLDRDQNDMEKCKKNDSENNRKVYENDTKNGDDAIDNTDCNNHERKHKEKKNNKIKIVHESVLEDENKNKNIEIVNGSGEEDKNKNTVVDNREIKKKKKKRKVDNETVPVEIKNKHENDNKNEFNWETEYAECNHDIKQKKSKKNERMSEIVIEEIKQSEYKEPKKKKRKHNISTNEENNTNRLEFLQEDISINVDQSASEGDKSISKHKKGEKTSETSDNRLDVDPNEKDYQNEDINAKEMKKKKKKSKIKDKKCEVLDISSENNLGSKNVSHVKKNKNKDNIQCEVLHISSENDLDSNDVPRKKKKKSKTKDNTQYELLDISSENNLVSLNQNPQKNKKK